LERRPIKTTPRSLRVNVRSAVKISIILTWSIKTSSEANPLGQYTLLQWRRY
jgi:hypothetical protein